MPRLIRRGRKKLGLSPGTLVHIGDKKIGEVKMSIMNYDQGQLSEKELTSIEDAFPYKDTPPVTWINVDGLHDVDIIDRIGRHFGIHPLTLEDIVNTGHRPKAEDFEDYEYIVLKMLKYDEAQNHVTAEQVSFILGPHYLISLFIPLTFIAGIYGMNFEFMPELKWRWAYPVLWILLIAIFVFMIFWFKRKKWI